MMWWTLLALATLAGGGNAEHGAFSVSTTTTTTTSPADKDDAKATLHAAEAFAGTTMSPPLPEAQALAGDDEKGQSSIEQDDVRTEDEYDEYEEDEYDDRVPEESSEDLDDEEVYDDEYEDDDEYEEVTSDDGDEAYSDEDDKEGAGDGEVRAREGVDVEAGEAEDVVVEDVEDVEDVEEEVATERRAEVRSLSDLPLSKLLRVQNELRRLTGRLPDKKEQCDGKDQEQKASRRWLTSDTKQQDQTATSPNAQPLNWGGGSRTRSTTTPAPVRRGGGGGGGGGGWHEEWEEEEEEEGGWITWNKGKKKGKGDIGSIFQISVTFLAFLAFGGYLLCLIMQAIKGGGYYPYYPGFGGGAPNGQLRPANYMVVMMPTRLANRRPTRPASTTAGRKRRKREDDQEGRREGDSQSWWPSWSEQDVRLLPQMDVERMHRALIVLAEGYASFYHKRYARRQ